MRFQDRREAGQILAEKLTHYADRPDVLVLGLPRGGVVVAFEVARKLHAPLDVFVVRKLGLPGEEELAMGAIASGGIRVLNERVIAAAQVPDSAIEQVVAREQAELERRERAYRNHRPAPQFAGRTVILVDDGIATGSTMRAAVEGLRQHNAARIVVAVPTAALSTYQDFSQLADEIVAVMTPAHFYAIGQWYDDFSQTTDEEVRDLLEQAAHSHIAGSS